MIINSSRKNRLVASLAGIGLVASATLVAAAPANAASGCNWLDYDQSNGNVIGECYGDHSGAKAHVTVHCNAVFPFTPWTNTHTVTVNYGLDFAYTISNCPWPASYSISGTVS
jgi:hypothetical protein